MTGANSGIGQQTAIELARHDPAQIWVAARTVSSGQETVEEIQAAGPNVDVRFVQIDLASFASIKAAAKTLLAAAAKLDILVLNAGIVSGCLRHSL